MIVIANFTTEPCTCKTDSKGCVKCHRPPTKLLYFRVGGNRSEKQPNLESAWSQGDVVSFYFVSWVLNGKLWDMFASNGYPRNTWGGCGGVKFTSRTNIWVLAQCCVTPHIALIGCRSTQMRQEEFWSVTIDNAPWIKKWTERFSD